MMLAIVIVIGWFLAAAGVMALLYAHGEREREPVSPEYVGGYKNRCPLCNWRQSAAQQYCGSCGVEFERGDAR